MAEIANSVLDHSTRSNDCIELDEVIEIAQNEQNPSGHEVQDPGEGELMVNDATNTAQVFVPPPLDEGKIYHAMICYESEDKKWAQDMFTQLVSEPYNLKCCIADIHFMPSVPVVENIETCMLQSMNAILVLSPEHLKSVYCAYETSLALEMWHERKGKLIPVLRRGEEVPTHLRFINYIDARHNIDHAEVMEKLIRAIVQDLPVDIGFHNINTQRKLNAEGIRITPEGKSRYGTYSMPAMTEEKMRECHSDGIKVTDAALQSIQRLTKDCRFCVYYWWYCNPLGIFCLTLWRMSMMGILIGMVIELWLLLTDDYDDSGTNAMLMLLVLGPVLTLIFILCQILMTRNELFAEKDILSYIITCKTWNNDTLTYMDDAFNKPRLHLVHYDFKACKNYIADHLIQQDFNDETSAADDRTNAEEADVIVMRALQPYIKVLTEGSPRAYRPRHTVRRDLVCLCQFVELKGLHLSQPTHRSCANCLIDACAAIGMACQNCLNRNRNGSSDTANLMVWLSI